MTLEEALHAYLMTQAPVVSLIGSRLYPEVAPTEAEMPYCTYTVASDIPVYHMQGPAGLTNAHAQLDVFAANAPTRTRIAKAVQAAIERWTQTQVATGSGFSMRFAGLDTQEDSYIEPTDGSERGVYQRSLDINVWYKN